LRLGFIGLGAMGRPMAEHLLRAGHELAVCARRPAALEPLVAAGAVACVDAAGVAAKSEVIFTMVTATADVRQVTLGEHGIIHGAAAGSVLVDMSTIAPVAACEIATALAMRGIAMLDAPVSGGSRGAHDASLAMMVGGDAAVLARVKPLLALFASNVVHVGAQGAGQVAKACNQAIMVAAIEACAEAARLAAASDVDFARVRDAMLSGSAASRVLEFFGDKMVRRDFAAGVEARLHHKDFAILLDAAARRGAPLPAAAAIGQQLNTLMARGWGGNDSSRLLSLLDA
jgi:2-hydroxy-3-oxopropionate reductase